MPEYEAVTYTHGNAPVFPMSDQAPDTLPPNTVHACVIPGVTEDVEQWIRPCKPTREWMDQVPDRYIYRCIPLLAANTMGWELLNPVDAMVRWDGSELNTGVQVRSQPHRFGPASHFGCGIVTWYLPFLFRTSPDLGLIVTGPANHEHNLAVPLDAFVRTDWLPFPFTMNWRLTEPDKIVEFAAGEPICRVLPYPLALLEETTLEIHDLAEDPAFLEEVNQWGIARQQNVAKQQQDAERWIETGERPSGDGVWNTQYVRRKGKEVADGFLPHQTVFRTPVPRDKRGGADGDDQGE